MKSREGIKFRDIGERLSNRKLSHSLIETWLCEARIEKLLLLNIVNKLTEKGVLWSDTRQTAQQVTAEILFRNIILLISWKQCLKKNCAIKYLSLRSQQCFQLFLFCCGDNKMSYCGLVKDILYGFCIGSLVSLSLILKDCCNCCILFCFFKLICVYL